MKKTRNFHYNNLDMAQGEIEALVYRNLDGGTFKETGNKINIFVGDKKVGAAIFKGDTFLVAYKTDFSFEVSTFFNGLYLTLNDHYPNR